MTNFFNLITQLQAQIDLLSDMLSGDENKTISIDGVQRSSVAKSISDSFESIKNMVSGNLTFETKADLDSFGAPPKGELATVWNDPNNMNNDIYGWNSVQWVSSKYTSKLDDTVENISTTKGLTSSAIINLLNSDYKSVDLLTSQGGGKPVTASAIIKYLSSNTGVDNLDQPAIDGIVTDGFLDSPEYPNNSLPALSPCTNATLKENYNVDHWLVIPAGTFHTDNNTLNNIYYSNRQGIKSGQWIQTALIVTVPNPGDNFPENKNLLLWDPVKLVSDDSFSSGIIEIDSTSRIYWMQGKAESNHDRVLVGTNFGGVSSNDFMLSCWGFRVLENKPAGFVVSVSKSKSIVDNVSSLNKKVNDIEAQLVIKDLTPEFSSEAFFTDDYDEQGWLNPIPEEMIIKNDDETVLDTLKYYGVSHWCKYQANTGYSDNASKNNCFIKNAGYNSDSLKGKWITYVLVVKRTSTSNNYPTLHDAFLWDGVKNYKPIWKEQVLDDLHSIFWCSFQVSDDNTSQTIAIGAQMDIYPYDFYIGGWHLYLTDEEVKSPPKFTKSAYDLIQTIDKRVNSLKSQIDNIEPPAISNDDFSNVIYAALGDSITFGSGSETSRSYVPRVAELLGFSSFVNHGQSGATCMDTAGRGKLKSQVQSVSENANLITVKIGVNDFYVNNELGSASLANSLSYEQLTTTNNFAESFRWCMETLRRERPLARIICILPLDTTLTANIPFSEFWKVQREICQQLAIPCVASYSESGVWPYYSGFVPDGVHPNDAGYEVFTNWLIRKIKSI